MDLGTTLLAQVAWALVVYGLVILIGALCPLAAAAAWLRLRRLDQSIGVRDREIELLHEVALLGPLPLPAIEQLARGLEPVSVPAGHIVFRQGDMGHRFYVIESGEAEVIGSDGLKLAPRPATPLLPVSIGTFFQASPIPSIGLPACGK